VRRRRLHAANSAKAPESHARWNEPDAARGAAATVQPVSSLPGSGATHCWFVSQIVGATQSATELHFVRQDPLLSHRYGVQSCVVPSTFLAV